jgi:hypothetical protein
MPDSPFDWFDLPNPQIRGFVIDAGEPQPHSLADCTLPAFKTSTVLWSDCPDWVKHAATVPTALQSYRLVHIAKAGKMRRQFFFAPNLSRETALVAYNSSADIDPSMFWPAVLLSLASYKRLDGSYITRPRYKNAYQGPTRVLIEEFFSPVPFEIPHYEPMIDRSVNDEIGFTYSIGLETYYQSVGSVNLLLCLHDEIDISVPLDPALTVGGVSYVNAAFYEAATNYTDWPDSIVVDDRQREVLGGWLRRRVTAYRPMIVRVTLPTSASVASTTATLGGTIAIEDNAVVSSRGVVYARTSLDANPEVGNSLATSVSTTGTTGTYTVAVTGLLPSTAYSFKPWALTSQGVRVYGPVGTFNTTA